MAGGDEDLGLGLRLPWGLVGPAPDKAFAPSSAGEQPASSAASPEARVDGAAALGGSPAVSAAPPGMVDPVDPVGLQQLLEPLLARVEGRFDQLDQRLAHIEAELEDRSVAAGGEAAGGEAMTAVLDRRADRLETLVANFHHATMAALSRAGATGARPEDGHEVVSPPLAARFERLESAVDASHNSLSDLVARRTSGVPVAHLEGRLARLEADLPGRLDRLRDQIDASHRMTAEALQGIAPAELVATLIQGVVATGEMIDAELIDLKRLMAGRVPSVAEPAGRRQPD